MEGGIVRRFSDRAERATAGCGGGVLFRLGAGCRATRNGRHRTEVFRGLPPDRAITNCVTATRHPLGYCSGPRSARRHRHRGHILLCRGGPRGGRSPTPPGGDKCFTRRYKLAYRPARPLAPRAQSSPAARWATRVNLPAPGVVPSRKRAVCLARSCRGRVVLSAAAAEGAGPPGDVWRAALCDRLRGKSRQIQRVG